MEGKLERSGEDFAVRLSAEDVRSLGLSEGATVEVTAKSTASATTHAPGSGRPSVNGIPRYTMQEFVAEARRLGSAFEPPSVEWGPDRGSEIIDDDDPR